jgi:hypothetical protein
MEYGAIIWDPYNKNDINKLENLQRRGARFITKDYKSREEGSMTKMLRNLASTTVCSVLECSTTTARVLFLTCEFTMFVVSQSWNVLALMCRLGFWWLIYS